MIWREKIRCFFFFFFFHFGWLQILQKKCFGGGAGGGGGGGLWDYFDNTISSISSIWYYNLITGQNRTKT